MPTFSPGKMGITHRVHPCGTRVVINHEAIGLNGSNHAYVSPRGVWGDLPRVQPRARGSSQSSLQLTCEFLAIHKHQIEHLLPEKTNMSTKDFAYYK